MKLKVLFKLILFFLTSAVTLRALLKQFAQRVKLYFHLRFLLFLFGDQSRIVANFGNSCLNKCLKNVSIVLTAAQSSDPKINLRRNDKLVQLLHWLSLIGCENVSIFSAQTTLLSPLEEEQTMLKAKISLQSLQCSDELFYVLQEQEHQSHNREKTSLSQLQDYKQVRDYLTKNGLIGLQKETSIPQVILVFDQGLNDLNLYGYPGLLRQQAQIYAMEKRLENVGCLDFIQKLKVFSGTEIRLGK